MIWKSKKRREEEEQARRIRRQEWEERRKKEEAEEKHWKELEAKYGVDRDEIQYQSRDGLESWNPRRYSRRQRLTPGHVGQIGLVRVNSGRTAGEEPYREDEVRFKWMNEARYFDNKENANVFTSGASGAGKSSLVRFLLRKMDGQQKLIFSFKPNDTHLRIGYPIADVSDLSPNPFRDVEAFVNAFAIAFPVTTIGITASQIPSLVQELVHGCSSWKDFNRKVERRIKETKDRVQLSALFFIQEQAKSIERHGLGDSEADLINEAVSSGIDVVLDFSRLSDSAKAFYAELLLRGIWNGIPSTASSDKKMIVYLDEAHRLTRGTFEKYHSVLNEMAREIRSRGALWTSTQNYSDIEDGIRNQFATQLVFSTSSKADLEALRAIDPMLSWTVSGLQKHRFVDAKERLIHEGITVYTFAPETKPDDAQLPLLRQFLSSVSPAQAARKTVDYGHVVAEALANSAVWVSGLAGQLSERYGLDKDEAKLRVRDVLEKLVNADEVQRMKCELPSGETVVLYYRRCEDENETRLHRWMVQRAVECCNKDAVIHVASSGEALPDVELSNCFIECETGLKKKTGDLEERIGKFSSLKPFVIVVPNADIRERYGWFASDRVLVVTLRHLSETIQGEFGSTAGRGGARDE